MKTKGVLAILLAVVFAALQGSPVAGQAAAGRLFLQGDTVFFFGPGKPRNCTLTSQFKHGDPIGFRYTAINPETGKRDRATRMVVHLTVGGKTIDVPMRDRQTEQQPEREFWVAKWIVPADAPTGIVHYTITATDPQGRTGEFKPFDVEASQLTIVE